MTATRFIHGEDARATIGISGKCNSESSDRNSFCFDFALRLRTAETNVSFSYIQPMPVPSADDVNMLPKLETWLAWKEGIAHISED